MKISIFGMGYIGCVTAACLADMEHDVIGYDSNPGKINLLREAKPPIKEEGLDELMYKVVIAAKKLQITDSMDFALKNSDLSFVCVGTPINLKGTLDTSYLENVCKDIADALLKIGAKQKKHIVVIRSSIVPGTIDYLKEIFIKKGLIPGKDFFIATNPELLREGTAVKDFMKPPHIIIGADEPEIADIVELVYSRIRAKVIKSSIKTSELVKLVNNSWHALKLDFANEVSSICKRANINTDELMEIFLSDTDLNISRYYFRPSIGFGGSCLPKDLAALSKKAKDLGLNCSLLNSIMESNINQIKRALQIIKEEAEKINTEEVGVYGIAFKPGTDDIRGSPVIYLIDHLRANGFHIKIFDPIIKKEQIENIKLSYRKTINDPLMNDLLEIDNFKDILPIIEEKLCSLDETFSSDIVIINTKLSLEEIKKFNEKQVIIDLQGVTSKEDLTKLKAKYVTLWK